MKDKGPLILIVASSADPSAQAVSGRLREAGAEPVVFSFADYPTRTRVSHLRDDADERLAFQVSGYSFEGTDVSAAWLRRAECPVLSSRVVRDGFREWGVRESQTFLRNALERLDVPWLPASPGLLARRETGRLPMLEAARAAGFSVPETLATNSAAELLAFAERHRGRIVMKKFHSSYRPGTDERYGRAILTVPVTPPMLRDFRFLDAGPAVFQVRVEKAFELRVVVIGDLVFAARILSASDRNARLDWRAGAFDPPPHERHQVDEGLAGRCRRLVRHLGLEFGTIDLAVTPDEREVFFELNPNGQWLWMESLLGLPLSASLAERLLHLATHPRTAGSEIRT